MASLPHIRDAAAIPRVLRLVRNTTVPSKVTTQHLKSNGFSEVDAPHLIGLMRALKFVDHSGRPMSLWGAYRDEPHNKEVLAAAVRDAYTALFTTLGDPSSRSDDEVAAAVRSMTNFNEGHVRETVLTLRGFSRAVAAAPSPPSALGTAQRSRPEVLREVAILASVSASEFGAAHRALRHDLPRAAHVSVWNGLVAIALGRMAADDFCALRAVRPGWTFDSIDELAMKTPGRALIDLLVELRLIEPGEEFEVAQLLQRRNDCAHPNAFNPTSEEAVLYVDDVLAVSLKLAQQPIS